MKLSSMLHSLKKSGYVKVELLSRRDKRREQELEGVVYLRE